ncbi:MAG: isoamylase early set domain-containing protein [Ardenticatenaceae bacterium]|nr:isoamylase early set domain-containing protein [Ardenticatenaceae bacterium]HBY94027.1 glycoside hydrolase [Chloroflexota bacterium]
MLRKRRLDEPGKVEVTFELPPTFWADEIYVVGEFNDWNRQANPMDHLRDGSWSLTLVLNADCEYEFRYLIDGRDWMGDPEADTHRPNEHGADNSVVSTD